MSVQLERIVSDHIDEQGLAGMGITNPPPLPLPVQRFCEEINKNFALTAENLDALAEKLEIASKDLRQRAVDLRDASPDVRAQVERWISFERESNDRAKFLATLFNK